jgi:GNAT superfamily N-acetyltransferase
VTVAPLRPGDRECWDVLAQGYKTFYETVLPETAYDRAWQRLMAGDAIHGLGAHLEGRLVGIAHYLFHANVWTADVCYLQDLFVDDAARGRGAARALIEAVVEDARQRGAARLYWMTRDDNATARALYDRVARHNGFIRYEHPLA